jgi:predicted short-subunit dehydrogenase-like oxidoreductase (DUF2520 family)
VRRPTIGIVGAGKLATALAPLLLAAGYRIVAVASSRMADARRLARRTRARACASGVDVLARAECVLLAVPDRTVAPLARALAASARQPLDGRTVLHHAGGLGSAALAPPARRGADVGVLHPFQTLGDPRIVGALLPGSAARIEGSPRARALARRIARDLGLVTLAPRTTPRDLAAYHAAAALAANDLLGLLALAERILAGTGVGHKAAERAVVRLAHGAVAHAERHGLARALTGPVVRGDGPTVRAHLAALSAVPGAVALHRALSREILRLAYPGARARSAAARALGRVLGPRRGPPRRPTV